MTTYPSPASYVIDCRQRPSGVWFVVPVMFVQVPWTNVHVSFNTASVVEPPNMTAYPSAASQAMLATYRPGGPLTLSSVHWLWEKVQVSVKRPAPLSPPNRRTYWSTGS